MAVYKNTAEAVDYILRGWPIRPEIRKVDQVYENTEKTVEKVAVQEKIKEEEDLASQKLKFSFSRQEYVKQVKDFKKIYIYAVSRTVLDKVLERLNLQAEITRNIEEADIVIVHKAFAKGGTKILSIANDYKLPIYYVRSNSMSQVQKVVKEALHITDSETLQGYYDDAERALDEAKAAIQKILEGADNVELQPQNQQIRKMQHELVEQHNLSSESVGEGPQRRLRIVGGSDFKHAG